MRHQNRQQHTSAEKLIKAKKKHFTLSAREAFNNEMFFLLRFVTESRYGVGSTVQPLLLLLNDLGVARSLFLF